MILFAVILLSSTLTIGTQNNVHKPELVDRNGNTGQIKIGGTHPIIQIAEATSEEKMKNEMRNNVPYKNTNQDSEINYYADKKSFQDNSQSNSDLGIIHEVTIESKELPNGQYGYIMKKHIVRDEDSETDLTSRYPNFPTIPGPTLEIHEGDLLILTSIDQNGSQKVQQIKAKSPGTFEYYGENFRTLGLFGAIIVDPYDNVPAQLNGKVVSVDLRDLEKQYVLFMVGSTFWGQEIDSKHNQKPLWTNPTLGADLNQLVRFHVLGALHQHTFHLHAHRWLDPGTTNIIDTKLIFPYQSHSFIVEAGDKVGIGNWQYHCHVFAHMEAGMMGTFKVGPVGSFTKSIPGASPLDGGPTEQGDFITFSITDDPGRYFKNVGGEIKIKDERGELVALTDTTESFGVVGKGGTVHFIMDDTNAVHTITSLLWPSEANNMPMQTISSHNEKVNSNQKLNQISLPPHMPFDQITAYSGGGIVKLETPGLYVFTCKIHPYMFAGVIADDPETTGFDLGDELELSTGDKVASSNDLSLALLRTFFIANNPSNWKDYSTDIPSDLKDSSVANSEWTPKFPHIPVKTDQKDVFYLDEALMTSMKETTILGNTQQQITGLDTIQNPSIPGVGEVWIDTQFEETANKTKPGTATKVNVENWKVERKVSLPQINMNHPHNMWSDSNQEVMYQTQWFDNRLTAFDRNTGTLLDDIKVGDAPSHVMTNPTNDRLYVVLSGEQGVAELDFDKQNNKFNILRIMPMQDSGQLPTHPHAHWITPNGEKMITPNHFTNDVTIFDFTKNQGKGEIQSRVNTGMMPIATGMMPDGKKAYVSSLLNSTVDLVDIESGEVIKTINLAKSGNFWPIQTPVSPNGQYVVTANTLSGTIAVIDTDADGNGVYDDPELVLNSTLPCDPGCHGVNFGAKNGVDTNITNDDGYYAYVSSKFSNRMIVVDADPNNDGNVTDAKIAGSVLLSGNYSSTGTPEYEVDDEIVKFDGMGGQGVYAVPNVYPGWVEKLDSTFDSQLADLQRDPIGTFKDFHTLPIPTLTNSSKDIDSPESLQSQYNEDKKIMLKQQEIMLKQQEIQKQMIQPLVKKEQQESSSSAMIKSHSKTESSLNILQPNNILGMIPIPYP